MDRINYAPLKRVLLAAGKTELEGRFTYQDYLNELVGTTTKSVPITEQQWEVMCDIVRQNIPIYASTIKHMIQNMEAKEKDG